MAQIVKMLEQKAQTYKNSGEKYFRSTAEVKLGDEVVMMSLKSKMALSDGDKVQLPYMFFQCQKFGADLDA